MMMNLSVEIPRELIIEATTEMNKIPCKRKQPVFDLYPSGEWVLDWCCGTNSGIGSDNGYGVGHVCKTGCALRIK